MGANLAPPGAPLISAAGRTNLTMASSTAGAPAATAGGVPSSAMGGGNFSRLTAERRTIHTPTPHQLHNLSSTLEDFEGTSIAARNVGLSEVPGGSGVGSGVGANSSGGGGGAVNFLKSLTQKIGGRG